MATDYQDLLALVKGRRSIHRYKSDPVPDEYVQKILEAARFAPSGANAQHWEFIVIKDPAVRARIIELFKEQAAVGKKMELTRKEALRAERAYSDPNEDPGFKDAPVWILLLGDQRTKEQFILSALYSVGEANFRSGLAMAFLYMHLAARSLGLGSQWVTSTALPLMTAQIKEFLGIPKDFVIYDMIAVGYPAHEPKPRPAKALSDIVHHDRYDRSKYKSDQQVEDFIIAERTRTRRPQRGATH
ncbi:MAG: nitroreductase family protein [Dehalococcoidia bacterium]|nr:nitroreductase family protein [Dehalococcoidia bacterium]